MDYKDSEKYKEARSSLTEDLMSIYDEFVADYRYAATRRHGRPYISYIVLADMVKAGWRCVEKRPPTSSSAILEVS